MRRRACADASGGGPGLPGPGLCAASYPWLRAGRPAWSDIWRSPLTMPPTRSPAANELVIDSTASAHARSGSRRDDAAPVTTSTTFWPGETAISTAFGGSAAGRAVHLLGADAGPGAQVADVEGEAQPGLAGGHGQRLVEPGQLGVAEDAVERAVGLVGTSGARSSDVAVSCDSASSARVIAGLRRGVVGVRVMGGSPGTAGAAERARRRTGVPDVEGRARAPWPAAGTFSGCGSYQIGSCSQGCPGCTGPGARRAGPQGQRGHDDHERQRDGDETSMVSATVTARQPTGRVPLTGGGSPPSPSTGVRAALVTTRAGGGAPTGGPPPAAPRARSAWPRRRVAPPASCRSGGRRRVQCSGTLTAGWPVTLYSAVNAA